MARRSLSSQVIEETDRAIGLLRPVQDITDPMTSHMVGAVLTSLQKVQDMCYAARTGPTDAIVTDTPLGVAFGADKLAQVRAKAPVTTKRPTAHRKSAGGNA